MVDPVGIYTRRSRPVMSENTTAIDLASVDSYCFNRQPIPQLWSLTECLHHLLQAKRMLRHVFDRKFGGQQITCNKRAIHDRWCMRVGEKLKAAWKEEDKQLFREKAKEVGFI